MNKRVLIYGEINEERMRQDEKWGGQNHDDQHHCEEWAELIREYAELAYNEEYFRKRMVQVAALAFAAIESYDRKK